MFAGSLILAFVIRNYGMLMTRVPLLMRCDFSIDGEEVRLMLWDTAGQEEFDAITKAYYRGAHACVLAFSTTDRDSFLALHSWKLKVNINYETNFFI